VTMPGFLLVAVTWGVQSRGHRSTSGQLLLGQAGGQAVMLQQVCEGGATLESRSRACLNEEAAARPRISCRTVESHRRRAYANLGVRGRTAAIIRALGRGIEDPTHEVMDPEPGLNHKRERRTGREPSSNIRHPYPAPKTT
jgi:hypothetical protein